jgi:hypothetical protein
MPVEHLQLLLLDTVMIEGEDIAVVQGEGICSCGSK